MTSQIVTAAAFAALFGAGIAGFAGHRSSEAIPAARIALAGGDGAAAAGQCRVDVRRSGTPGAAAITRAVLGGGQCVCTIATGPAEGNGSAEALVKALLRDRECEGAPAPSEAQGASAAGGGAGLGFLPALAAAGAAGGAAAGAGGASGNHSPG